MTHPVATARPLLTVHQGNEPVLVTAIHAGHEMRPELQQIIQLDESSRLHEEDPFTDAWICIADNYIVPQRSRFEVDLNRPRGEAVYQSAEDAWGLDIWKTPPTEAMVEHSLAEYDMFYQQLRDLLDEMQARYGHFVIYDLHTYNYRRGGADAPPADAVENPDVNVGTGTMDRSYWAPVVDMFIEQLKSFNYPGGHLDVRENVKFKGRAFAQWVHGHYPQSVCVLSIEIKKFFMDEWSGMGDPVKIQALRQALASTIPGVKQALSIL
jgi:N-formylglutamate amidohydrolase